MIAKIRYHEKIRYHSEILQRSEFHHCSCHCSISSSFDILHSRLAEIDRRPYEIDGNQPDFGYDWIDKIICLPIPAKKTTKTTSECNQKYNRDPNMSIGLIIIISTQKALKTY